MKGIKANKTWLEMGRARLFVKKPIPIFAKQIDETFWVETLEGNHQGKEGDYLVQGIKGELYVCDKEIFEESYELLNPYMSEDIAENNRRKIKNLEAENLRLKEQLEESRRLRAEMAKRLEVAERELKGWFIMTR